MSRAAVGYGLPAGASPWAGNVYLSTPDTTTPIILITGLVERVRVDVNGNVGIGTTNPTARLDVSGPIRVGSDANACSSAKEGRLRYNSTVHMMEFCNGSIWFPMGAKIYQVSNPPGGVADPFSLDQNHQTVFCDAGDKVLGGGGTCPLCDTAGNPACAYGNVYIDHNSQAITQSGQEGWAYDCDMQDNNISDSTSTFAICLDLPPYH